MLYNQQDVQSICISTCTNGVYMEENEVQIEEIIEETAVEAENEAPVQPEAEEKADKKNEKVTKKDILISLGIVLSVAVLVICIIIASVFGIAHTNAKEQLAVEQADGEEWSKVYLHAWLNSRNNATNNNLNLPEGTFEYELVEFELKKFDKDLKIERPIENSHYIYAYTFAVRNERYKVTMDATNGQILSVEIDD